MFSGNQFVQVLTAALIPVIERGLLISVQREVGL